MTIVGSVFSLTGSLKPSLLSLQIASRSPVRNFQCWTSALAFFAYSLSTCGVSCSGSTVKLTNRTSSQSGLSCNCPWNSLIFAVCAGQVAVHRVKIKFAIQALPRNWREPNVSTAWSVNSNSGNYPSTGWDFLLRIIPSVLSDSVRLNLK